MNKLLILSSVLCVYCVGLCTSDVIPVAVNSHRRIENIEIPNVETGEQPYSSHVFEIEPSSQPLRIVFSSESSPLSLEVERAFRDTPIHAIPGPDAKLDRRGAIGPDARPTNFANDGAGAINEDEYEIVDHYQRYVPVRVRDDNEKVMGGSEEQVVIVKPEVTERVVVVRPPKSAKTEVKQKVKKVVKVPVIKAEKLTTSKPLAAKHVAATKPTARVTKPTPAEQMTTPSTNNKAKFGVRLARQTKKEETPKMTEKAEKAKN